MKMFNFKKKDEVEEPPQVPTHQVIYLDKYIDSFPEKGNIWYLQKAKQAHRYQSTALHVQQELARRKENDRRQGICTECGGPADYGCEEDGA